jgi:hypothetical protein
VKTPEVGDILLCRNFNTVATIYEGIYIVVKIAEHEGYTKYYLNRRVFHQEWHSLGDYFTHMNWRLYVKAIL